MLIELDAVDRITAGAVGPAGARVFYLQARQGARLITLLVEKQQVQLLAASIVEILARIGRETGEGPPEKQMALDEPILPEWRAGRLTVGYQEERDLVMLEAEELLDEEGEPAEGDVEAEGSTELDEPAGLDEGLAAIEQELAADGLGDLEAEPGVGGQEDLEREAERVRFWATREQMLSLARHGTLVCAAGRPRCPLCGNPLEPGGHHCPALSLNGHRESDQS